MTDSLRDQTHRRPDTAAMAQPLLTFDLAREIERLQREPEWQKGQNAKTLVKHDDFRAVLIVLRAKARIPEHETEGRISIHALRGHIRVTTSGGTADLPAGRLLAWTEACGTTSMRPRTARSC